MKGGMKMKGMMTMKGGMKNMGMGGSSPIGGEAACEGKSLNQQQCAEVGCCQWDNKCFSAVGTEPCNNNINLPVPVTLPTYGSGTVTLDWVDGAGVFAPCFKTTTVFGVTICVSPSAWENSPPKCNHIANVVLQLLDNDADGKVNDDTLVRYMIAQGFHMLVPNTRSDYQLMDKPQVGTGIPTGIWEAFPNSCDSPQNRGASGTDRSTWAEAVANTPGSTGCDQNRDATTEEVIHLMTYAAGELYPETWAATETSTAGEAIFAMNGNCGWGYSSDYKDPSGSNPECTGLYAYEFEMFRYLVVIEGIYWSTVAWIGGLMTNDRAQSVSNEWLMTVPDASMISVLPSGQTNARTLEEGSPAMYDLISDTTSEGHEWLPTIMPDGRYNVIN